jgi:Xaa-Pro aminopeptidase
MIDSFANRSDAELLAELCQEIDALARLAPEDQQRLVGMARDLAEQGMAPPFVIAGVRSSAEVLAELKVEERESAMNRPEVRRFIEENAVSSRSGAVFRGNDVKRAERERLHQQVVSAIRDARRSYGRHEVKKTRNMLLKIDQRELRRRLGREGDELCREINTILRAKTPML